MHIVKYPNPHTKGLSLGWSGLGNLTRMNTAVHITHVSPKGPVNRLCMMVCKVLRSLYLKSLAFSLRLDELLHLRIHGLALGSQGSESKSDPDGEHFSSF